MKVNRKTALIIGGNGGIGKYIVREMIRAGYEVTFTYNSSSGNQLSVETGASACKLDVRDEKAIATLAEEFREKHEKLDAIVYCSGVFEDSLTDKMELESWERVISVNLTGAFLIAKHMLPLLRLSGNGRFLCTGSVMGESGVYGSCSYAASKAGMIGLVKSIALENTKYNVTANVVSFGYIDTGMTDQLPEKVLESAMKKIPMKRLGRPEDAAKVIVDLCAEHTNYISGQVIRINGLLYV